MTGSRASRIELAAVAIGLTGVAALLFAIDPAATTLLPPCPFFTLTGLYCPGCGSTRAVHQLLNGHLGAAFGLNALLMVFLPVFGYSFASYASRHLSGRPLPSPRLTGRAIRAVLALIVAFAILRNLPVEPFSTLAP